MKAQIALVTGAAFIILGMVGCGGTSSTPSTTNTPPSSNSGGSGSASGGSGSGSSSGGSSGESSSGGNSQTAIAFAYVGTINRSTAGIYGFSIAPDGTATAVTGSPATGPSGDVITNSAFVFGTDSANIASYARANDGSLKQASITYAVMSTGPSPWALQGMSLDHTGQTLYAMENAGSDDLYYLFFSIGSDGKLTNIGKVGPGVDYGSPLVFSPDNNYAYGEGCFHADWDITGFHRNSDGTLTPMGTNAAIPAFAGNAAQRYCPVGEAISQSGYLAIADDELGTNTSGVGIYKLNGDGSLALVQNSVLATQLSQINSINFDRSGQYLAVAGTGGIQMYQLTPAGTLAPIGGIQQAGPNYLTVQWDADNHVYATSSAGLYVFTSSQGVLTPASGSPHAAGTAETLAVLPTH